MAQKLDVIDADGHILEPVDLWQTHIDPKFRGRGLQLVANNDGSETLLVDGKRLGGKGTKFGLLGSIGARYGDLPGHIPYLDGRRGGFDPHARITDMERDGIDAAFLYPSLGLFVAGIEDVELAAATARAYNRWLAEYCAPYPDRLYGIAMLPFQSIEKTVEEIEFAAKELGFRGGFIRPNPYGGRCLHHPDHDRIWEVAQDLEFCIGIHEGQGSGQPTLAEDRFETRAAKHCVSHMFEMEAAAVSVLMMGIADRYPKLRFGFLEASGGWMAGLLDRMDRHFDDEGMNDLNISMRPSELFRRQCFISFEPVEGALKVLADYIGSDSILWATDYPHLDGFWGAPKMIRDLGLKDQTLANVLGGGAKRFYGLD